MQRSKAFVALGWVYLAVCTQVAGVQAEETPQNSESGLFNSLVSIVVDNSSITLEDTDTFAQEADLPSYLKDIVEEYYAEAVVDETVAEDVLSYLTEVYSEHGYHDTGSWAKPERRFSYKPYKGTLPEFNYEDFKMPASGVLTSSYGYRPRFGRFHRGIDMAVNIGDTVCCALPGVVVLTGYEAKGYGRYVVVSHSGGWETLYGHLSHTIVAPGDKMDIGSPIGLGGSSGNSTGPHLHFETRYRGVAVDPFTWFSK